MPHSASIFSSVSEGFRFSRFRHYLFTFVPTPLHPVNDFSDARVNVLPITEDNEHCLRTKYEARNAKELPVLTRFFDRERLLDGKDESDVFPIAKYIDLILYSREQIDKENEAMGKTKDGESAPWGIVSIKAQDVDHELPMTPITASESPRFCVSLLRTALAPLVH